MAHGVGRGLLAVRKLPHIVGGVYRDGNPTISIRRSYQTGPITANEVCGLMRDRSERPQCCLGVDAGAFEGPLRSTQRTSIRVMDKPPSHRGAEWKSNNGR